jgi:SPP1 gp7 family putative phage head morphogenesis protein
VSLYIPTRPAKAGPIGPGAGVLMTEFPLSSLGGQQSPQQKMRQAWKLGIEVPWIRAAELVIAGKIQGLPWHIEDGDGDTVDDDYTGTDAQEIRTLIEKPMANLPVGQQMFRTALWRLTARHIGLCGNGFWYLDGLNTFGEPNAILYIRPDRMSVNEDNNGNLISWQLDKTATNPGLTISLEESIHFVLDPPDIGHFGTGLVESAMLWAANSQGLDRHVSMLIGSGGRLSGLLSPKSGSPSPEQSLQMERDWRTIVDTSDAAKRLQIVNAPVDFQKTTLTPSELLLIEMMTYQRDSLMGLWGVPLTAIGIHERGSAMSAGAAKVTESDDQTLLDHAVKPRTEPFRENLQARLLDPYQSQGETFTLVLDYQTFDDNSLTYVNAAQALGQPLSNNQRLNILGLDPIDPSVIGESGGPLGDEVWMPATQVYSFTQAVGIKPKPEPEAIATPPPTGEMDSASLSAGETTQGGAQVANAKARVTPPLHPTIRPLHTALVSLRNRIAAAKTPILRRSVHAVLEDQKREIAARLRKLPADHFVKNPTDTSAWFPRTFDAKLSAALAPHLDVMASSVNAQIHDVLPVKPAKAAPAGAVERVMARGAARVTKINETTRDKIKDAIVRGLEAGVTINDVADSIEGIGAATIGGLDLGSLFDEYRAEMIARTELMDAYNSSAIASYTDAGIEYVQAIDGDGDPECAARDGQIYASDDADSIEDHPNGTLDWVPVIDDSQKATSEPFRPIIPVDTADVLAFAADHAQKANSALERVSGMQLAQAALDQIGVHARATSDLADAVRNTPPAIHNIEAPIVNVLPADPDVYNINVPPLDISGVTDAINVQTEALRQKPTVKTVQRDSNNRIATVLTTPIETPMDAEPDHDPDDA